MKILDFKGRRKAGRCAAGVLALLVLCRSMAGEIRSLVLAGQTVAVEEITEEAPVLFRAMRFNEAAGQWTVSLEIGRAHV